MRRPAVLSAALAAVALLGGTLALADRWQPCKFACAALYRYRLTHYEDGRPTALTLTLDVQAVEEKGPKGEPLVRVLRTTEQVMPMKAIDASVTFGIPTLLALAPQMMYGNSMFAAMAEGLDLTDGGLLDLGKEGRAVVARRETVAGIEGFLVDLFARDGDAEAKVAELVLRSDLPFPLRSRMYVEGDLVFEMELLHHERHDD